MEYKHQILGIVVPTRPEEFIEFAEQHRLPVEFYFNEEINEFVRPRCPPSADFRVQQRHLRSGNSIKGYCYSAFMRIKVGNVYNYSEGLAMTAKVERFQDLRDSALNRFEELTKKAQRKCLDVQISMNKFSNPQRLNVRHK